MFGLPFFIQLIFNMIKGLISPRILVLLTSFLILTAFSTAKDSVDEKKTATQADRAIQQVLDSTQQQMLRHLATNLGARWERHHELITSMAYKNGSPIEVYDSLVYVRLVGFDLFAHPIYYATQNLTAAHTITTSRLWTGGLSDLNLDGEGITLNVWDAGRLRHTHREFQDRTIQKDDAPHIHAHATHVSGTMVAAGINPAAKGMAPKATLHVYDFVNDEEEMAIAASEGAIISNHSYGRPTGWLFHGGQWWWYGDTRVSTTQDYMFGFYGEETRTRDEITYYAPYFLQVHAAGNDRNNTGPAPGAEHNVFDHELNQWVKSTAIRQPDGGEQGFDCISSLVLGKNVLTIGSVGDLPEYTGPESVVLSEFSSTGPTDDGRIKPDVVANGQVVMSTWVDNDASYAGLTGTSMAAPTVSGSLGLLQELHKRKHGSYMRASTLKALVIHTARETGPHPGPDYRYGWGLANMEAAAKIIPSKDNTTRIHEGNLIQNTLPTYSRQVYSTGQSPLVATLAWTDVPGTPLAPALNDRTPSLVNDLDLRITRLSDGEVFYPWRLNPDNPSAAATRGDNMVDNVERVDIIAPEPGFYRVEVTHKGEIVDLINATNKRQAFSLIISGIAERNIDLAVTTIRMLVSGCEFSDQTPFSATIMNKGRNLAEAFSFSYQVKNEKGDITEESTMTLGPLEPGKSLDVNFTADLSRGFEFSITGTVNIAGDQLPANNSFTRQVVAGNWIVSDERFHTNFDGIERFENIGWQSINANNDQAGWLLRRSATETQWASSGNNSARYGNLNPDQDGVEVMQQADDYLVSNCFYLYENETYRLSFDYRSWNIDSKESMRIVIGQQADPEALTTVLHDMPGFATADFEDQQIQFSVDHDGTWYVAFHVYSPSDHRFIYIDNIALERMVLHDLRPTALEVEGDGCGFTQETPVHARIFNAGEQAQQGFPVELHLYHRQTDNTTIYTHDFSEELLPDTYADVAFNVDMSLYGQYKLHLVTALENDERPQNDTLSITAVNASVNLERNNFFTNFDDINGLDEIDWTIINVNNDMTLWRFYRTPGQAYSIPHSMNYYRQVRNQADDWLITSCLIMEEGNYYRVRFQTSTQISNAKEEFRLYLMHDINPEDTLFTLGEVVVNTVDYVEEEFMFKAPYTGNFYIGFYVDYLGPQSVQFFIDDVHIEKVPDFDVAITGISQVNYGCGAFTEETPVEVRVKNRGARVLANQEVRLLVEDESGMGSNYTIVVDDEIGMDEEVVVEFLADLSRLNTIFTVTAKAILNEDELPSNNILTTHIRNTTVDLTAGHVYFNDFEMTHVDGGGADIDPFMGWWYENSNNEYHDEFTEITWRYRKHEPFARSGEISVRSGRSTEQPADDWLFSNCFIMQAGEQYLLSFYYTGRQSNREETMAVHLGTGQSSDQMGEKLWEKTFNTAIEYKEAVIAFTPPEDGTYYIGFHAKSAADQGWIYLDDFSMQQNHDLDISLDEITVMETACRFTEETPIRIQVRNSGNKSLDQPITINYKLYDPKEQLLAEGNELIEAPMESGQVEYIEIMADLRRFGIYTFEASAGLSAETAEPETGNNSLSVQIFNTSMDPAIENLYLTFEEFSSLEDIGWKVVDSNHDGSTWDLRAASLYAYSGSQVFMYEFSAENDADDWLFSNCAKLKAGVVYNVGYHYRVFDGDYAEHIAFGIADDRSPNTNIRILEAREDIDNYSYRRVTYSFSVDEDGDYFFAWHATSPGFRRYYFMDDFYLHKAREIDGGVHDLRVSSSSCATDENTELTVILTNLGSSLLPAGELTLNINGPSGNQAVSVETPAIPVQDQAQVNLSADMSVYGRYTVNYDLEIPGDMQTSNNKGSRVLHSNRIELDEPGDWFVQDFNQLFALREAGWKVYNLNTNNRYWGLRRDDPANAFRGSNYLVYFTGSSTLDADDWAISGCYWLTAGRPYKAAFFYKLGSGEHNLRLAMSQGNQPQDMENLIWEGANLTAPDPNEHRQAGGYFQVEQDGYYHFGIHQFSQGGQGSSIVDHLVVVARPEIIPLDAAVGYGDVVTIQALGTDSLAWFKDEDLTQLLGRGAQLDLTIDETAHFEIFAAEYISGVMGPADRVQIQLNTGLDDPQAKPGFNLFPNPAGNQLFIETTQPLHGELTIMIFDLTGRQSLVKTIHNQQQSVALDISHLPAGAYLIRVNSPNQVFTGRFIKTE